MKSDTGLPKYIRDGVLLGVGGFMLLFMTVSGKVFLPLVGAALVVLGVPVGIRTTEIIRDAIGGRGSSSSRDGRSSPQSSRSQSVDHLEGDTDDQRTH